MLDPGEWVESGELLSRLKNKHPEVSKDVDIVSFRRNLLNVMGEIRRKGSRTEGQEDAIQLARAGWAVLEIPHSPLFQALVKRHALEEDETEMSISDLELEEVQSR